MKTKTIALIVCGVLFLALLIGGTFWYKGSGETQIRALMEKTMQPLTDEITAHDARISDNEKKVDAAAQQAQAAEKKAIDAGARAQVLAAQVVAVRPAQTDEEVKARYEKLGYHPVFK
jgi:predicted  nucleic acid-binding Zn-ribbon protein